MKKSKDDYDGVEVVCIEDSKPSKKKAVNKTPEPSTLTQPEAPGSPAPIVGNVVSAVKSGLDGVQQAVNLKSSSSLAKYVRSMGWVILFASIIGAVYLFATFSFVTTVSGYYTLSTHEEFTFLGIILGLGSLAAGMFLHSIALGIAALLEKQ